VNEAKRLLALPLGERLNFTLTESGKMNLYTEAQDLFEFTQTLRRDFHRHPEIGFKEVRTAGIVARELHSLGLEVSTGIAETGVVALIEGESPGPVLMLRFDMDALPIHEETGTEYASQTPGVMHACGHDGHTAVGLTVARLLLAQRSSLAGTVKLVFQPAEEGLGGAKRMIDEGVLENPRPDFALGMHVWNEKPYGWMAATDGSCMAASETFEVTITGRGGHGAAPHQTLDPVLAAAHVVTALQGIVARNVDPVETAVISATSIHAGEAHNVIPSVAHLKGTIRSFLPEVRTLVLERFQTVVEGVSAAMGCQAEVSVRSITPALVNDPEISQKVRETARRLLPDLQIENGTRTMGSEDMAYFLEKVPGCFFFLGSANPEKGLDAAHHHPRFDFDERALSAGAALIAAAAVELLRG
jgi:amidohydrolase